MLRPSAAFKLMPWLSSWELLAVTPVCKEMLLIASAMDERSISLLPVKAIEADVTPLMTTAALLPAVVLMALLPATVV